MQGEGADAVTIDGGRSSSVVTAIGVGSDTVLEGFTVTNGSADWGGGIYVENSSLLVTNNIIRDNTAVGGGGLYVGSGVWGVPAERSPVITNNTIANNTCSQEGGGISVHFALPTIANNSIHNNTVSGSNSGGGIYILKSSISITNNDISSNIGGGIWMSGVEGSITNNRIVNNRYSTRPSIGGIAMHRSTLSISNNIITGNSGGILIEGLSSPILVNNIIANNTLITSIGVQCLEDIFGGKPSPSIMNSILWGNGDDLSGEGCVATYSDIEDGDPGEGNICADPMFVDTLGGDYHLRAGSPCIDTGNNTGAPSIDFDGNPRPFDGDRDGIAIVDMGAFEFIPTVIYVPDDYPTIQQALIIMQVMEIQLLSEMEFMQKI